MQELELTLQIVVQSSDGIWQGQDRYEKREEDPEDSITVQGEIGKVLRRDSLAHQE